MGLACPELADVRADFRANLVAFWRIHALYMSWENGISRPTRARVCELGGFGVSTYKACRAWWEARGYLTIVRRGWTPALRALALVGPEDRNEAQSYALCAPRKHRLSLLRSGQAISRPLACSRSEQVTLARAHGTAGKPGSRSIRPAALRTWPLRGVTDGWWTHLTRPFLAAGWTEADVIHAVDHGPAGKPWRQRLANVRRPVSWLRWRLTHWLTAEGAPLSSPSQARAVAAAAHRAYLAKRERVTPLRARAAAIRQARENTIVTTGENGLDVPVAVQLAGLRARLGRPLGSHWTAPAELARQQAEEARAARGRG